MKKSLKYNTLFYGLSKYTTVFVTLLTTAVLSRILSPTEFGIVSVITVFTAFFSILADLGLGTAIIQNKTLSDNEIDDIFSFSVFVALFLGIAFGMLGMPISWFYENALYKKICLLLSISVFFPPFHPLKYQFHPQPLLLYCPSFPAGHLSAIASPYFAVNE